MATNDLDRELSEHGFHVEDPMTTYKIIRFYRDESHPDHHKVIATGLTLDEAQEHCQDESTHEVDDDGVVWFDGFTVEGGDPEQATRLTRQYLSDEKATKLTQQYLSEE